MEKSVRSSSPSAIIENVQEKYMRHHFLPQMTHALEEDEEGGRRNRIVSLLHPILFPGISLMEGEKGIYVVLGSIGGPKKRGVGKKFGPISREQEGCCPELTHFLSNFFFLIGKSTKKFPSDISSTVKRWSVAFSLLLCRNFCQPFCIFAATLIRVRSPPV